MDRVKSEAFCPDWLRTLEAFVRSSLTSVLQPVEVSKVRVERVLCEHAKYYLQVEAYRLKLFFQVSPRTKPPYLIEHMLKALIEMQAAKLKELGHVDVLKAWREEGEEVLFYD